MVAFSDVLERVTDGSFLILNHVHVKPGQPSTCTLSSCPLLLVD